MERMVRIELTSLVWKTKALPLDDTRNPGAEGANRMLVDCLPCNCSTIELLRHKMEHRALIEKASPVYETGASPSMLTQQYVFPFDPPSGCGSSMPNGCVGPGAFPPARTYRLDWWQGCESNARPPRYERGHLPSDCTLLYVWS